ncbi:MAG: hypothetical protein UV58_C0007G0039 [Candidatus Wolfebacteria bacterium GW2011_GWC1_43_10]|nr:MAG: hypothetical protein UV58_C0007G0039 [Candidatus Wolfebacteria bacterium GW2011_GWC1_43_10]KKT22511.1 MAG: hypothetical protein UW08_C0007G0007 [Parcubacteria group bacterium GW2011_GWB1_43_8b]
MDQKGFANIVLVVVMVILLGTAGYFVFVENTEPAKPTIEMPTPSNTQELIPEEIPKTKTQLNEPAAGQKDITEEIQKDKGIVPPTGNTSVTRKGWAKTFGGDFNSAVNAVQQTSDGGYIATGWIGSGTVYPYNPNNPITLERTAVYLVKMDANGNEVWNKSFGGPGMSMSVCSGYDDSIICTLNKNNPSGLFDNATGHSVQQTSDGGYVIAGMYHSGKLHNRTSLTDHQQSEYDKGDEVFLIKTDANGNMQWNKTFDGEEVDEMGRSVQQTSDGGYFIVGITTSYGASPYTAKELGQVAPQDIYLIKTDANGNKVWKKVFGGTRIDMAFSGQQTSDGGYIVAGLTASWSGKKDIYRKASGALAVEDEGYIYAECIGGHIDNERELPCAEDMYLLKIDADGNKVWEKTFGMKNNRSDAGYSIQQTSDGGYIIVGQTFWHVLDSEGAISWNDARSDVYLVKTDANGNVIWEKTFGRNSSDFGYSVQQTTDGGYIVSGFTTTPFESFESLLAKYEKLGIEKPFEKVIEKDIEKSKLPAGGRIKPYLIKTDSNGNKIWERIFEDGFGRDWTWTTTWPGGMNSVRQTSDGGYIIAAGNKHTHDIPRGPTEPTPLTMGEGYDAYIIKTDANGNR